MIPNGREIQCLPYKGFFCIGATIRTRREFQCLPYKGFFTVLYNSKITIVIGQVFHIWIDKNFETIN